MGEGERTASAPYKEETRVRARQLAMRVPQARETQVIRARGMVGDQPSPDIARFPSTAWEQGLAAVDTDALEIAARSRPLGGSADDDGPHGLVQSLAHRLLDALLHWLEDTRRSQNC